MRYGVMHYGVMGARVMVLGMIRYSPYTLKIRDIFLKIQQRPICSVCGVAPMALLIQSSYISSSLVVL